ncbi:MAG: cyclic nucleotide-binding domain-containing protein, partial [Planctomycetota bacterium]
MPEKPVSFFGRLALKKNYVTPEQLHECVSIQLAAEEQGAAPPRLGEVLVRKGYMTEEQVREVLALQKKAPSTATAAAPEKMVATFEPGAVVFREGDEDHRDLYILLEGVVREEKNGILLHEFATQGAFLGPIATLLKVPRATTVVAKSAVKVFRVPEENVEIFFRNRPAMAIRLGEVLAERLHNIMRQHVESAADAARGLPAGSTPDAASGEAAVAGLGGMAQLAEDGKGRLVLRDIQVPDAAYVNGYAATDETVLRDQDNVQIGQYMLQVFYDHPGLIRPEPEASPGGEAPEEPVPAAAASTAGAGDEAVPPPPLAEAAPPPSADSGSEPLADEALAAAVDAARSEPFPGAVRQAVGLQIGFHLQAEALDGRRVALLDGLAEDAPEREDVKREVERQRREIEKPPPASSPEQSIGKLEAQLAPPAPAEAADGDAPDDEDAEAPQNGPPPLSDGMRAAYGIALEQKRLFLERERNLP